jgi:hypothetical protein
VLDTADQEFVWAKDKLKHEVLKHTQEHHIPGKETRRHVTGKPVWWNRYGAWKTEQQITELAAAGKDKAAGVVIDQLLPQARELPLLGGIVEWLQKRAV